MHDETTPPGSAAEALRRHRWLAALVFLGAATTAASALAFLPNVYRATATVVVQREDVPEAFVRAAVTTELETRIQMLSQEMLSRARLEPLIDRFGLYPEMRGRAPLEQIVNRLRNDIKLDMTAGASPAGRPATVAFALSYAGTDPPTVALVANSLATSYVEKNVQTREGQARGTALLLKTQLDEVKQRLDVQDKQVATLRAHFGAELPEQTTANLAAMERLSTELRFNHDKQQRALDRRDALRVEPVVIAPVAPEQSPSAKRLADLKDDLVQLRARFGARHPDVRRAETAIAALEREQPPTAARARPAVTASADDARPRAALADAENEIRRLDGEEQSLKQQMATYELRVQNAPNRGQQISETSRDYGTTVELYYSLLQRYEDARLSESMETGRTGEQFQILDPALAPTAPSAPNRLPLLALALILSGVMAAGAVFLAEQLDSSIHTLDELRAFVNLPVLCTIPPIVTARDQVRQRWRVALAGTGTVLGLLLLAFIAHHLADGNVSLVRMLARGKV